MIVTSSNVSNLLNGVRRILSHQKEVERLKGEKFNVFSVLKMESRENDTHSAFLGELLNPAGTHLKGALFLKYFLQYIHLETHLDIGSACLKLEHHVGTRDDVSKTGGRVDIILWDKRNHTLCIENKIYAGDQVAQVERYCNYNKGKNKVIYLNLHGEEPGVESKGELIAGIDFIVLSYKKDIIAWLESCLKEATDAPILRETIKQYIILLKKMTSTTDNQYDKALIDLLLNHFEEASFVASNFARAKQRLLDDIRTAVMEKLSAALSSEFNIVRGAPIDKRYAQVWIQFKAHPASDIYFGIETFNGEGNFGGNLFVGVFNLDGKTNSYTLEKNKDKAKWWYDEQFIEVEGSIINFANSALIMKLQSDGDYRDKLIEQIVRETVDFVENHKGQLLKHLN